MRDEKLNYQGLWRLLKQVYDEDEAKAVARMIFETRYGLSLADLLMGRDADIPQEELQQIAHRLLGNEPVQYVLGETDFCGRSFHVEPGVLIPRPETAELCRMIIDKMRDGKMRDGKMRSERLEMRDMITDEGGNTGTDGDDISQLRILDIGTGSGCIAITLAAELPQARVTACDISPIALRIAAGNARRHHVDIDFREVDALSISPSSFLLPPSSKSTPTSPLWDLIVSNPPYICDSEADEMSANVLEYEPEIALFVPDDDPLRFYRPIMNYAQSALLPGGTLWLECNPLYEEFIEERLLELGFEDVKPHDDQFGKTRFVEAIR